MGAEYSFRDADVISPEVYGRVSHPHQAFAWLRANDPLRPVAVGVDLQGIVGERQDERRRPGAGSRCHAARRPTGNGLCFLRNQRLGSSWLLSVPLMK